MASRHDQPVIGIASKPGQRVRALGASTIVLALTACGADNDPALENPPSPSLSREDNRSTDLDDRSFIPAPPDTDLPTHSPSPSAVPEASPSSITFVPKPPGVPLPSIPSEREVAAAPGSLADAFGIDQRTFDLAMKYGNFNTPHVDGYTLLAIMEVRSHMTPDAYMPSVGESGDGALGIAGFSAERARELAAQTVCDPLELEDQMAILQVELYEAIQQLDKKNFPVHEGNIVKEALLGFFSGTSANFPGATDAETAKISQLAGPLRGAAGKEQHLSGPSDPQEQGNLTLARGCATDSMGL